MLKSPEILNKIESITFNYLYKIGPIEKSLFSQIIRVNKLDVKNMFSKLNLDIVISLNGLTIYIKDELMIWFNINSIFVKFIKLF